MLKKVYFASKAKEAPMWRKVARKLPEGIVNISSWIYHTGETDSDLWFKATREAASADFVVALIEPGELHKGDLVEVGACLGAGGRVLLCGDTPEGHSWMNHPMVRWAPTVERALECVVSPMCAQFISERKP